MILTDSEKSKDLETFWGVTRFGIRNTHLYILDGESDLTRAIRSVQMNIVSVQLVEYRILTSNAK